MTQPYVIQLFEEQTPVILEIGIGLAFAVPLTNPVYTTTTGSDFKTDVRNSSGELIFSLSSDDSEIISGVPFEEDNTGPAQEGIQVQFPGAKTGLLEVGQIYDWDVLIKPPESADWLPFFRPMQLRPIKTVTQP